MIPPILLLFYSISVFIFDHWLQRKKKIAVQITSVFGAIKATKSQNIGFSILLFIGVFSSVIYFQMTIGLDGLLADDLDNVRIDGRKGYGWFALASISLVTVPAIFLLSNLNLRRGKMTFLTITVISFISLLLIGNRGPAFEVIVIAIVLYYAKVHGGLNFFKMTAVGGILLAMLGSLNLFRQGDEYALELLALKTVWRPYVNIDNFNEVSSYFSVNRPLNGYGYLMDLMVVAPGNQENFGTWFKTVAGMDFTGGGVTVTYAGEILSNFGIYFLPPIALMYFLVIFILDKLKFEKTMSSLGFTHSAVLAITAKSFVSSGLVSPLLYTYVPMFAALIIGSVLSAIVKMWRRPLITA